MRISRSAVSVKAPREVVWAAITVPEHVREWQYNSDLETDWIVGRPIRFRAQWQGQTFEQWGTVEEFIPPSRLRYSLFAPRPGLADLPENYFTMTYQLVDVEGGTEVSFIHEDPRTSEDAEEVSEEENPVLTALRDVAESLANS
jgi:uncharacterized protein YndB with AHSA1/START domain